MMAASVALGSQYSAGEKTKRVNRMKADVTMPLSGLLTRHSELTAVRDMAPPTGMTLKKLLTRLVTPR